MSVDLKWPENHAEDSTTLEAIVVGPTNRTDLFVEIVANIPAYYGTLIFSRLESADLVAGHLDVWKCRLKYAAFREKQELQVGDNEFRFGSANRTITRTFSLSSTVFDADGEVDPAPADARVIGYNEQDRKATGTKVTEYINSFSWRVAIDAETVSESWRRDAGNLKGSLCTDTFFGYPSGEVLFKDMTGNLKGDGVYVFNLDFLQGENPGDITIGGINVTGVEFWDEIDGDDQKLIEENGIIIPEVRRVKVHRMKRKSSWSLLTSLLGMA